MDDLERRVTELRDAIAFPPTPAIAPVVVERLRARQPGPRWRIAPALVFGVAAALLVAGIVAAGLLIGGVRILPVGSPSLLPEAVVGERGLGSQVSLDEARARAAFEIAIPRLDSLGEPDRVYFADPPAGGQVALVYGARPGYPADPETAIGVVVMEFRSTIAEGTFDKLVAEGVRVEFVEIEGATAAWIAGGDHFFAYRDANGRLVEGRLRLVGDTLLWERDGITYRVEGAPSLEAALAIAESLP